MFIRELTLVNIADDPLSPAASAAPANNAKRNFF
jgi:hypothetical protein